MSEDNTAVLERSLVSLQHAPHVLTTLIDLFLGDSQSALEQREHIQDHLMTCHFCRTAFLLFLTTIQEYEKANGLDNTIPGDLVTRFSNLSRQLEASAFTDYELLGAYAEAIIDGGVKSAAQRFPELDSHLPMCSTCRTTIAHTVADIILLESPD